MAFLDCVERGSPDLACYLLSGYYLQRQCYCQYGGHNELFGNGSVQRTPGTVKLYLSRRRRCVCVCVCVWRGGVCVCYQSVCLSVCLSAISSVSKTAPTSGPYSLHTQARVSYFISLITYSHYIYLTGFIDLINRLPFRQFSINKEKFGLFVRTSPRSTSAIHTLVIT